MIDVPILMLGGCILAVTAIGTIGTIRRDKRSKEMKHRLLDDRSAFHVEDYHADTRCDICFDDVKGEVVCDCTCGKTFHRTCAEPTGSCPYCGTVFDNFPIKERESRMLTCFRCGRAVEGNICECGTVIPFKDKTFRCPCGEELREESEWCPNFGRTFERRIALADKSLFPKE